MTSREEYCNDIVRIERLYQWQMSGRYSELPAKDATEGELSRHLMSALNMKWHPVFYRGDGPAILRKAQMAARLYYNLSSEIADTTGPEGAWPENMSMHPGFVASLVRSIVFWRMEGSVDNEHSQIAKLSDLETHASVDFNATVLPLVRYFVDFLDTRRLLREEDILSVDVPAFQLSVIRRVSEAGVFSHAGFLETAANMTLPQVLIPDFYLTTSPEPKKDLLESLCSKAIWFPYAKLAARLIPGFTPALDNAYHNGPHKHMLLASEFSEDVARPSPGNGHLFFY